MGQYYAVVIKDENGKINYNLREVKGEGYMMAKLLEHSYFKNHLVDSVANLLFKHKCRLAWVGDYSEQPELDEITNKEVDYKKVWGNYDDKENPIVLNENEVRQEFIYKKFCYTRKYLVNWDKKEYISFDDYKKGYKFPNKTLVVSPIPLMTAVGNGRGGGDYHDDNPYCDEVGTWAWNEISIESKIPDGFKKLVVCFKENWICEKEYELEKKMEKDKKKKNTKGGLSNSKERKLK